MGLNLVNTCQKVTTKKIHEALLRCTKWREGFVKNSSNDENITTNEWMTNDGDKNNYHSKLIEREKAAKGRSLS